MAGTHAREGFASGVLAIAALAASVSSQEPARPAEPPRSVAAHLSAMPWQRTLDDGLALSRASGMPLLVCVNADGETASDALAARLYRDPAFVALAAGFVPVLASVDRHARADRDGRGARIEDPRFGRLVCGEHEALEPLVYERWLGGRRVAPRHIGVAPDGRVLFDVYLTELEAISRALAEHGRPDLRLPVVSAGDARAQLGSRDAAVRGALESGFLSAGGAERLALIGLAASAADPVPPVELLAMGLRDAAPDVRAASLDLASQRAGELPAWLLVDAARVASTAEDGSRLALLTRQLAASGDPRALRSAGLHAGLLERSAVVDLEAWAAALGAATATPAPPVLGAAALAAEVERLGLALLAIPADGSLLVAEATALLDLADASLDADEETVAWWREAGLESARHAAALQPASGEAWAVLARAESVAGSLDDAAAAAERAIPWLLEQPGTLLSADVLDALALARGEQLRIAVDADEAWPGSWVADLVAAAEVLLIHPQAADWQLASALDGLVALGLDGTHGRLARAGLLRDLRSADLHEQWRWHLLRDGDAVEALRAYDALPATPSDAAAVGWYAAYAALAAGDHLRGELRWAAARDAYDACVQRFDAIGWRDAELADPLPFVALAQTGLALILLAGGNPLAAAESMVAALDRCPSAADLPDGLGATPREAARSIQRALIAAGHREAADAVEAAVARLP